MSKKDRFSGNCAQCGLPMSGKAGQSVCYYWHKPTLDRIKAQREQTVAMRRYRALEKRLIDVREKHGGIESKEEEEVLEQMDETWKDLNDDEQAQLRSEEPKSKIAERACPDGGKCHHSCGPNDRCFRVDTCGPLSGVFPNDEWPPEVEAFGGVAPTREVVKAVAAITGAMKDGVDLGDLDRLVGIGELVAKMAYPSADDDIGEPILKALFGDAVPPGGPGTPSHFVHILEDAARQCFEGKGEERHGHGVPFDRQHWNVLSSALGTSAGLEYQAAKKMLEAGRIPLDDFARYKKEVLGVVTYAVLAIMWRELQAGKASS